MTREILTDRDTAFVIGQTSDGAAILAPEWVERCRLLGIVARACRPYRAKTKGKVERIVRELKERFIPWPQVSTCPDIRVWLTTTSWLDAVNGHLKVRSFGQVKVRTPRSLLLALTYS